MKKILKISQLTRKRTTIFLLLNFVFSTLLFAFPQKKCDGMCSLDLELHQCSTIVDNQCCDMMGLDAKHNSITCGMSIAENSCNFELDPIDNSTFIISETVDLKVILTEIFSIVLDIDQNISTSLTLAQNIIPDISPPIYLTVSSFLI